jgi:uncharacterized protein YjiS (DUF1127 family)
MIHSMTSGQQTALAPPEEDEEPIHRRSIRPFWQWLSAALRRPIDRRDSRRALRTLSPRMLRDLGLHPDDLDWL